MASMIGSRLCPNGVMAYSERGWEFGIDGLADKSVFDQFLELHVQYTRRSFREYLVQFAGAQRTVAEFVQDTGFPFGADQTHGQSAGGIPDRPGSSVRTCGYSPLFI